MHFSLCTANYTPHLCTESYTSHLWTSGYTPHLCTASYTPASYTPHPCNASYTLHLCTLGYTPASYTPASYTLHLCTASCAPHTWQMCSAQQLQAQSLAQSTVGRRRKHRLQPPRSSCKARRAQRQRDVCLWQQCYESCVIV